jgi:hypothetical protein
MQRIPQGRFGQPGEFSSGQFRVSVGICGIVAKCKRRQKNGPKTIALSGVREG